jgi:hypothetical protein
MSDSRRSQSSSPEISSHHIMNAALKRDGSHPLPLTPQRKKREVKTSIIDHTYNDYSRCHITNAADLLERMKHRDSTKHTATFPEILHRMLSNPKYKDIICWQPHGRAWRVLDKERLISVACAENYRLKSFESFTRQGENQ